MSDYATQLAGSGTANTAAGTTSTPATTPAPVAPTTAAPMTATPGASVNASPAAQQNTWLARNNPAKNTEANETLYKGYLAQGLPKDRAAYMSRYDETLPRTADIGNTQQPQQALTGATAPIPTATTPAAASTTPSEPSIWDEPSASATTLAPAPKAPNVEIPQGTPANVLPTAPYTAPTPPTSFSNAHANALKPTVAAPGAPPVNVSVPQAGQPNKLPASQFTAPNPNLRAPQITPTDPNAPRALTPEEFPDNPLYNAGDEAAGNLARFSNQQNILRQNNDVAASDLPQGTTAQQQAQTRLSRYLDQKRAQR